MAEKPVAYTAGSKRHRFDASSGKSAAMIACFSGLRQVSMTAGCRGHGLRDIVLRSSLNAPGSSRCWFAATLLAPRARAGLTMPLP